MARGDRDLGKEQFWRGILQQWDSREQTVREFCADHGVSEPSFYAWRRTIAERDRQAAARRVSATAAADDPPTFVPVQVVGGTKTTPMPEVAAGTKTTPMLEVVVAPKRVVRVPPDFDAGTLQRLLTLLDGEATPC